MPFRPLIFNKQKRSPQTRVLFWLTSSLIFVAICVLGSIDYFENALGRPIDLLSLANSIKFGSILIMIWVNGHIMHGIDRNQIEVKIYNIIVIVISSIICGFLFFKIFLPNVDVSFINNSSFYYEYSAFIYEKITYFSAAPLILYLFLDAYIAFIKPYKSLDRSQRAKEQRIARSYVLYVDLVCIFPLVIIYAAPFLLLEKMDFHEADLFYAGVMSLVLFSSSIATEVVTIYNT